MPRPCRPSTFTSTTSAFEATAINVDKKKQSAASKQVTPQIRDVVTELFQNGYVDPSGWGDTGAIEDLFTKDAQAQLEANVDTLTLGTDADAIFSTVQPSKSKLKVTALTDANAGVIRAMAQPWFHAIAANDDGTFTDITVTGTLFLVQDGNDWKIESFSLNREMSPAKPPDVYLPVHVPLGVRMTKKILAIVLGLSAWIAGTVAATVGQSGTAAAQTLFKIERAHADYTPTLDGPTRSSF